MSLITGFMSLMTSFMSPIDVPEAESRSAFN